MLFGVELAFREIIMDEHILPDCTNISVIDSDQAQLDKDRNLSFIPHQDECDEDFAVLFLGVLVSRRLFRYFIYYGGMLCIGKSLVV